MSKVWPVFTDSCSRAWLEGTVFIGLLDTECKKLRGFLSQKVVFRSILEALVMVKRQFHGLDGLKWEVQHPLCMQLHIQEF